MSRFISQFSAVTTEGGLLPQDILSRIHAADSTLPGTSADSYHLPAHERTRDAASRAWSRLQVAWRGFQQALEKEPETSRATQITRDRWLLPLFKELEYGRLPKGKAINIEGKNFAISHSWQHSPIHLLGCRIELDRRQKGVAGAAQSSPHGLVQDFLNRSDDHLWGFLSNGYRLRILRDHHSLTRQAYVEFDLQAIMDGEQYSDFLMLWLLCHQSRVEAEKPEECFLEQWAKTSQEEGVRALDKLRAGVEKAIEAFGTGFLAHKANTKLHEALESGDLDKQDYYRQLLRLAYRLIFIFVTEERGLLLDPESSENARDRYRQYYSSQRFRKLCDKRRGGPHTDLWRSMALVMGKLDDGCPELALPALGSRLWGSRACPDLMNAECANEHLLNAIRSLSFVQEGAIHYPVNWRNIGADELGSVYESLLELHPKINKDASRFELDTAAGHERKTTGSYYTPTSLVNCLLDSALEPVVARAKKQQDPKAAILDLNVCDPACGSGHFLVAAARRLAKHLASVLCGDDEPSPGDYQKAIRLVVSRCIYGVDINPMAVELCKVSLWLEALEPGKPLSFLDSRIQCGNSLIGATPALMSRGIPDVAFFPIEGDDKTVCQALKKRNKKERQNLKSNQRDWLETFDKLTSDSEKIGVAVLRVDSIEEDNIESLRKKERNWEAFEHSTEFKESVFRANVWCSAFLWPKSKQDSQEIAITTELWESVNKDPTTLPKLSRKIVKSLSSEYQFFHWHLAFPQVFGTANTTIEKADTTGWAGGFDVIVGNPPWEKIKILEKEWFSEKSPSVSSARNASERNKLIKKLMTEFPDLGLEFQAAKRHAEGFSHILRRSSAYPLCGRGDLNTYSVFAETYRFLLNNKGYVGCVIPPGIATDDSNKLFIQALVDNEELVLFYDFTNRGYTFVDVESTMSFSILVFSRQRIPTFKVAAKLWKVAQLHEGGRVYSLSREDIHRISPNTKNLPIFKSARDADLVTNLYRFIPVLHNEGVQDGNPWGISFLRMFDSANNSNLFKTHAVLVDSGCKLSGNIFANNETRFLPLYESKLANQFTHRAGTFAGIDPSLIFGTRAATCKPTDQELLNPQFTVLPRYWISEQEVVKRCKTVSKRQWLLGFRRTISAVADARSSTFFILPRYGTTDSIFLLFSNRKIEELCVLSSIGNSFVFDYVTRQKASGGNLSYYVVKQLPIPKPESIDNWIYNVVKPRVLELTYTSWDLKPFAEDCGYDGPPFPWNPERRFLLQSELDAAYFHLYRIKRSDVEYIMEAFPIVKRRDITSYKRYRTKEQVLEIYDLMQKTIDTGEPYKSLLEPAPADPCLAHPENTSPKWSETSNTSDDALANASPEIERRDLLAFRKRSDNDLNMDEEAELTKLNAKLEEMLPKLPEIPREVRMAVNELKRLLKLEETNGNH